MHLNLSVDQVLSTTRSVRKRLDLSRPVPRAVIEECLELALQAPNGSNRNNWRWILVDDPAVIAKIGAMYKDVMDGIIEAKRAEQSSIPGSGHVLDSGFNFASRIGAVPALLIPLMKGRADGQTVPEQAGMWGSIVQAVWSFFLALRERGLGSVWTSISLYREREIAELLGIPFEKHTQVGLFPIAYTVGTDFKKAWRKPVSEVLTYNKY
jgi:nitroreductase